MVSTASTMQALGTNAPQFTLRNTNPTVGGELISSSDYASQKALLVAFICNHCPYVIHIRNAFTQFASEFGSQGLAVIAINSNDADNYPDDGPEKMTEAAALHGFNFPYLYDEHQSVAKAFQAACTPDFFLFNDDRELVYRGQFDTSRPNNSEPVTGSDLRRAVEAVLAGTACEAQQIASMGCNIKWKAGEAPDYFST